jgi:hypothetical protein
MTSGVGRDQLTAAKAVASEKTGKAPELRPDGADGGAADARHWRRLEIKKLQQPT